MQSIVVLFSLALCLTTLNALPWSPSDPMEPSLFQLYRQQKQRNLAKIQLLPQNAISFVGPRQATSLEEDADEEDVGYYEDDEEYEDDEHENSPIEYAESEEVDYEWR